MTAEEILALTRDLLDDAALPYLWTQTELITYLNRSLNDIARDALYFTDSETVAICQYHVLAGKLLYTQDPRIIRINSGKLASSTLPLGKTTIALLNKYESAWRTRETDFPTCIIPEADRGKFGIWPMYSGYFDDVSVTIVGAAKTITGASGSGFDDEFEADDEIFLEDSVLNTSTYTIHSVTDTVITIHETTLVNEGPITVTLRTVSDTVNLEVSRMPLTPFSVTNLTSTPELHSMYHDRLPYGIMKYAYLKQDSQTYDSDLSKEFGKTFSGAIAEIKRDGIFSEHFNDVISPHPGTI